MTLPFSWTYFHGAGRTNERFLLVGVIAVAIGLAMMRTGNWVIALMVPVVLVSATIEMWVPTRYRLTEQYVEVRKGLGLSRLLWTDVKRIEVTELGVRLSPLAKPSRLDAFRGVSVRFAGNQDEVLGIITAQLNANAGQLVSGIEHGGATGGDDPNRERDSQAGSGNASDPDA